MEERLPGGRWSAELETGGEPATQCGIKLGFSVAKEAVDCGLLVSECQLMLFRHTSFFSGKGRGVIWDSTVPCI